MIITPLIFYGCKFLSAYLRTRGESAANSARRFIPLESQTEINADGYFMTNVYGVGHSNKIKFAKNKKRIDIR